MADKLTLTKHNGRAGKNGVYNPKHNDRSFDIQASEHIDAERTKENIYCDWINGLYNWNGTTLDNETVEERFEEVEKIYYRAHYKKYCDAQHERNRKAGHSNRDRSTEDLRLSRKTCPEEAIIQIGSREDQVDAEVLYRIATEYFTEFINRFGKHVHLLNFSLHCDEATPHIHARYVFDCENKYGEIMPQQEKALEALGIPLPHPDQPSSRTNNRKVMFDSICRTMLMDIAKSHGLDMQEEPVYGGREYLEKQDYIMMHQKEKIEKQQNLIADKAAELNTLTVRIDDTNRFVQEITDAAYEKAVTVVADEAVRITHKAYTAKIADYWNNHGMKDPKLNKETRQHIVRHLKMITEKLKDLSAALSKSVVEILQRPDRSEHNKKPIRRSVLEKLEEAKKDVDQSGLERRPAGIDTRKYQHPNR